MKRVHACKKQIYTYKNNKFSVLELGLLLVKEVMEKHHSAFSLKLKEGMCRISPWDTHLFAGWVVLRTGSGNGLQLVMMRRKNGGLSSGVCHAGYVFV
ncbi:MAG: hypothetical protein RRY20_01795 [Bilophila sp.]